MRGEASVKVPGGKLVRVKAEYTETFDDVTITGDFFLQPPEALSKLEDAIEGHATDAEIDAIAATIDNVDAELIGFSADDLAEAARKVVE
jgi:lipoate-protein ligase A